MKIAAGDYVIRSWASRDAACLMESVNNHNITEKLAVRFPRNYTLDHAKAWIDLCALEADPVNFAIAEGDSAIGGIGLTLQRGVRHRSAEIGFWIAETHWGIGIATTVVQSFVRFAFQRFDLVRVAAYVFDGNIASIRVLEKAGFSFEGRLESSVIKDGKFVDELIYAKVRR